MNTATSGHWHFPGWRPLAVASAVGLITPALSFAVGRVVPLGHEPHFNWSPHALMVFFLATLPFFMPLEEWVFRGVILRWLARWWAGPVGVIAALVISSALFSAAHGFAASMSGRFAVGLALGVVYLRTRSLWASIATHTVHNLVLIAFALLTQ